MGESSKKYRVTGQHAVFGYAPGQTFEKAIGSKHEARLIAGGAIKRISGVYAAKQAAEPAEKE